MKATAENKYAYEYAGGLHAFYICMRNLEKGREVGKPLSVVRGNEKNVPIYHSHIVCGHDIEMRLRRLEPDPKSLEELKNADCCCD